MKGFGRRMSVARATEVQRLRFAGWPTAPGDLWVRRFGKVQSSSNLTERESRRWAGFARPAPAYARLNQP